ncbi:hypothetical protein [Bifidobacterium vespertilionis]|uniref:hypothetical protein n=1 Tax=Bifidobacterium vespertilionis TaxID=2562524 RepID=UPI001BDC5708|nr:hypothetical protein [Bifidobacterium vespertilionis]MBT1180267.1 hypothetical protein [Bifidobacterium vespertilionis]
MMLSEISAGFSRERACGKRYLCNPCLLFNEHPVRLLMLVVATVLAVAEWIRTPPYTDIGIAIGAIHIILVILLAYVPVQASLLFQLMELVCCFLPPQPAPSRQWGAWVSLGLLSYESKSLILIFGSLLFISVVQTLQTSIFDIVWHNTGSFVSSSMSIVTFIGSFIVAMGIGYAFQWRKDADRLHAVEAHMKLVQRENELYYRNSLYATSMHDSIASALSNIALMTQMELQDQSRPIDKRLLATINEQSNSALAQVHHLIDQLNSPYDKSSQRSIQVDKFMQHLKQTACDGDACLNALGFHGKTVINGKLAVVSLSSDSADAILSLLHEIYCNIHIHADNNDPYQLVLTLHNSLIEIVETNTISLNAEKRDGGYGLNLHFKRIHVLCGSSEYKEMNGNWILYASIPMNENACINSVKS